MLSFTEVQKKMEQFIRKGGLQEDKCYSQVSSKSYDLLVDINKFGFITIDSQDAYGLHDDCGIWERPYIQGFVQQNSFVIKKLEKLCSKNRNFKLIIHKFIVNQTRSSSKLLKINVPVTENISKFKRIAVTKVYVTQSVEELYFQLHQLNMLQTSDVKMVTVIDLNFNNDATQKLGLFTQIQRCLC